MTEPKQTIEIPIWKLDANGLRPYERGYYVMKLVNHVENESGGGWLVELNAPAMKYKDVMKVWVSRMDLEDALRRLGPQR